MRVAHDGIELNVEVQGPQDGPPVAFLHGVSGSSLAFGWLPAAITEGRRILRIDLRGHGVSGHADGTYTLERYGEDVAAVLREVAGGPAVVVGHSLGGSVGWWLAQNRPELLTAAFLEDPPLYFGEVAEHEASPIAQVFPLMRDNAIAWQRDGVDPETAAAQLAAAPFGPDPSVKAADILQPDSIRALAQSHLVMDPQVLTAAVNRSTLAPTDTDSPVTVPVQLLVGEPSLGGLFLSTHEERLAASHPDIAITRIAGAGHTLHAELNTRATYLEHLARFLDEHAPV